MRLLRAFSNLLTLTLARALIRLSLAALAAALRIRPELGDPRL